MTVNQTLYDYPPCDVEKKQEFCKFSVWTFTVRDFLFYCFLLQENE